VRTEYNWAARHETVTLPDVVPPAGVRFTTEDSDGLIASVLVWLLDRDVQRLFPCRLHECGLGPRSEWITRTNEAQRIVPDELWERAQRRIAPPAGDTKVNTGGSPAWYTLPNGEKRMKRKYLLSGLLRCAVCGCHYTIVDAYNYGCHSHQDGACTNAVRVRRDEVQKVLIGPINERLQSPELVDLMAKELQALYAEEMKARQTRAAAAPKELQDLTARIERLRERLKTATRT